MEPYPFLIRGKVIKEIKVGAVIAWGDVDIRITKIMSVTLDDDVLEVIGMCKSVM